MRYYSVFLRPLFISLHFQIDLSLVNVLFSAQLDCYCCVGMHAVSCYVYIWHLFDVLRIQLVFHQNSCIYASEYLCFLTWLDPKKKIIYKQKVIQNVGSYSLFCSRTVMHLKRWTIHAPQNASFSNWYTYFGMDSMNLFSLSYNIEKEKKTPPTTTATAKQ